MKPVLEFPNIFNSVNPDALIPKAKKLVPFPLENFDEEIGTAYNNVDRILKKLDGALANPINHTPARKRRIKSLQYKTKTCLSLLKEISKSASEL